MLGALRSPSGVVVVVRVAGVMSSEIGLETGDVIHSVNQVSNRLVEFSPGGSDADQAT